MEDAENLVTIQIPDPSLVLLIGPSGVGKSTFARAHFRPTQVLSSDFCRALVCDDESDQTATDDAFELLHLILAKRLLRRRTTVIDATNVQASARKPLNEAARRHNVPLIGIVFALSDTICRERNRQRPERVVGDDVITSQVQSLRVSMPVFQAEGFSALYRLQSVDDADSVIIQSTKNV